MSWELDDDGPMSPKILIIEDDERIRTSMALALEDEGYEVVGAADGEHALEIFGLGLVTHPFDLAIIDIMLPGINGFECCHELRRQSDLPIIMVTARTDTHDVVAGLEAGADDYVTKPFEPKELAARIRALLRRAHTTSSTTSNLSFGELEIQLEAGVVRLAGNELHLTRTEFLLLCELATNPNKVLSREQLLERIWSYDYFGDGRLVDVHIRRLRTKVELDPGNPRHIITVRGLGYKLAP
jgi:DNA-binding response OmpR family regulator